MQEMANAITSFAPFLLRFADGKAFFDLAALLNADLSSWLKLQVISMCKFHWESQLAYLESSSSASLAYLVCFLPASTIGAEVLKIKTSDAIKKAVFVSEGFFTHSSSSSTMKVYAFWPTRAVPLDDHEI